MLHLRGTAVSVLGVPAELVHQQFVLRESEPLEDAEVDEVVEHAVEAVDGVIVQRN